MKYMASEDWARMGETTHSNLGSFKVEILQGDTCVADRFIETGLY